MYLVESREDTLLINNEIKKCTYSQVALQFNYYFITKYVLIM